MTKLDDEKTKNAEFCKGYAVGRGVYRNMYAHYFEGVEAGLHDALKTPEIGENVMNAMQFWQATLDRLQAELSPAIFATWFKDTGALCLQDSVLTIRASTLFTKTQLESRFNEQIRTIVSEIAGRPIDIRFEVPDTTEYRSVITQTFNPWAETTTVEQLLILLEAERGVDIVVDALSKKTMTADETKRLLRDLECIIEEAKKGIERFGSKDE